MRRLIVHLGLFVIAAFLTVIVAWRSSVFYAGFSTAAPSDSLTESEIAVLWREHSDLPLLASAYGSRYRVSGQRTIVIESSTEFDYSNEQAFRTNACTVDDFGWPMVALRRRTLLEASMANQTWDLDWTWRIGNGRTRCLLPLRPLWTGAIVDTALYFALLLLLKLGLTRTIRRARIDRGLCPRCKYDMRTSIAAPTARCSECGAVVPASRFERPRKILRLWMTPLLLAPLALAIFWFIDGVYWSWTRFQLRYIEPIVSRDTILYGLVAFAWIFVLCEISYRDRPRWQRHLLAVLIAGVLSVVGFASALALAHRVLYGFG